VHRIIIDIDRPAPLAEDGNDFKEGGFAYRLREDLVLGVLKCPWEWVMVDKVVPRRKGDGIRVHCSLWVPQPNPNGEVTDILSLPFLSVSLSISLSLSICLSVYIYI
jgi:hypothetical protein